MFKAGLDPNFNRFWTGESLAQFAVQLGTIALPIISVQLLHASEAQLGYLNAASTAAFLVLGLPAGAWVDRWLKRPTLIAANLTRAMAVSAVPVLYFTGSLQLWHLYIVAAVVGLATVFFDVAYQSFIPILVGVHRIGRANSRMEASVQLARLAGPSIGGLLLKVLAAPVLLGAVGVGYLISSIFLIATHDKEKSLRRPPTRERNLWAEIREGLSYVVHSAPISRITLANLLSSVAYTFAMTLVPLVVLRLIGMTSFQYGLSMAVGAAGGLVGASLSGRLTTKYGTADVVRFSALGATVMLLAYPLALLAADSRPLAMGIIFTLGFLGNIAVLIYNITQVSLRQRLCPLPLLSRMNASVRFIVWGAMPISALAAGWLSTALGITTILWVMVLLGLVSAVPLWRISRHLPADIR